MSSLILEHQLIYQSWPYTWSRWNVFIVAIFSITMPSLSSSNYSNISKVKRTNMSPRYNNCSPNTKDKWVGVTFNAHKVLRCGETLSHPPASRLGPEPPWSTSWFRVLSHVFISIDLGALTVPPSVFSKYWDLEYVHSVYISRMGIGLEVWSGFQCVIEVT